MSDPDDESLILELIRRIDSRVDAAEGRLAGRLDSIATMLEGQLAAGERLTDEIDDLRRLVEEYHAELIRETGERLRRASSPVAGTD